MYKSNSQSFNFKACQMLFIYIEEFRMFEDQLVPLNPQFDVMKQDEYYYVTDSDEVIHTDETIQFNVVSIVGKNGVGKTTFLELLSGRHSRDAKYIICWMDDKGNLASNSLDFVFYNGKKICLDQSVHNFSLRSLCGNSNLDEENSIRRGFLSAYNSEPKIFDIYNEPLFDGFELQLSINFDEHLELAEELTKHTGIEVDAINFRSIVKKHPTFLILASIAQDSTFADIAENLNLSPKNRNFDKVYEVLSNQKSLDLDKKIHNLLYENSISDAHADLTLIERLKKDEYVNKGYSISEYPTIFDEVNKLSKEIDLWMNNTLSKVERKLRENRIINLHIWEGRFYDLYDFSPYRQKESSRVYFYNFSSGQRQRIRTLFNIGPKIVSEYANWYNFDDCDNHLHPEWCRLYISELRKTHIKFCDNIAKVRNDKNYIKRTMTCLLVTHSPFILSDLNKNAVLRLSKEKDENGDDIHDGLTIISRATDSPFAGVIGELLHDDFFMKSTIGEHAKTILEDEIKALDEYPSNPKVIERAEHIFKQVGDKILRRMLLERIKYANN